MLTIIDQFILLDMQVLDWMDKHIAVALLTPLLVNTEAMDLKSGQDSLEHRIMI